jgi:hypothetical protein
MKGTERSPRFNRRDFLRISFFAFLGLIAGNYAGPHLLPKPPRREFLFPENAQAFYTLEEEDYPAVAWVTANLVIASNILNRLVIPPNSSFSLLDALSVKNSSGGIGEKFVEGVDLFTRQMVPGLGLCKVATDIFRCALLSPVEITESHTHAYLPPTHPYFREHPYGTDAAIFYNNNKEIYDLVLKNPFDIDLGIKYWVFDNQGHLLLAPHILNYSDYFLATFYKIIEGARALNIPIPQGIFPDLLAEERITTVTYFHPIGSVGEIPSWHASYTTKKEESGKIRLERVLTIDGKKFVYSRSSIYDGV